MYNYTSPNSDMMKETHVIHQASNTRGILVGDKIVDHADVVGESPLSTAPTTSSSLT